MASKVFISWGGELSKKLAEEVRNWLPSVLQFVKPYFTPDDIEKGSRWESNIANELETSNVGIICLTKDNINRPWILFEAGALSKNFGKSKVCTILFNIDSTEITGPLTSFQTTKFDKLDFKKLIKTINDTGGDAKLDSKVLDDVFEMWWPRLEERISEIIKGYKEAEHTEIRSEREILEEILELTRMYAKHSPRKSNKGRYVIKILMEYIEQFYFIGKDNYKNVSYEELFNAIEILCYEFDCLDLLDNFKLLRNKYMNIIR